LEEGILEETEKKKGKGGGDLGALPRVAHAEKKSGKRKSDAKRGKFQE